MPGQLQSVGSPGSPASPYGPMPGEQSAFDLSKSMSKEITVQQLLTFLLRDVEKTKHYRRLPFYILFLAVLTTLIGLTGLGDVWYNEFADHNNAISQMFQREGLKVTDSHDELWTWLSQTLDWAWVDSATSSTSEEVCQLAASKAACRIPCSWVEGRNCTASPVGRRNVALGFLLLRQWRVDDAEQCTEHTGDRLIPESVRQSLPKTCTKRYRSSVASTRAYGGPTGNLYVSDEEAGGVAVGSDITTLVHTFEKQHQFSTRFSFERGLKEAQQNLTNLRLNGWVTPETRLVALSAVFYNPNTLAFLSNDAYIEFFHTGKVLSGYLARPFPVLSLDSDVDRAVFALDVMHLVLCCPILMWSFVRAVRDNMTWMRIPGSTAIGLWEVFEFFHIVSHVVTAVYRVYLWAESLKMTRPDFYEGETDEMAIMFNNLVFYSHLWRTGWAWCCCAVVMAYLRSFKYLQHNQRLCVLSETIRTAAGDLAGMSVIFTVVIIAYGIGGTMLYSSEIAEFTSFGTSCVYLLQVLFAGEIVGGIWDQLFRMHSLASPLYMLTYFLLSWVVLLNMVIAALSNAFILVVQQQAFHRRGEASGAARTSIWFDIIKGVRKGWKRLNGQQLLGNAKTEDSDAASEAESLGGGEGSLRGGTAPARSRRKGRDPTEFLMLRTNKLKERFLAVSGALKSLADEKIGLSDDPQFAYLGEMRYSQIYVTWAEVNDCLGGILTESQRLQMFTHIHKLVACDEKNREVVNVSQRYVNKLSDEISDALNALRKGGVAGGPVGPSAHPAATATRNPLHGGGGGGGTCWCLDVTGVVAVHVVVAFLDAAVDDAGSEHGPRWRRLPARHFAAGASTEGAERRCFCGWH
eukprot:Rhum_TRINITY_DN14666_c16_g1::Rhum_TRINITY_DN14666_c16_g1_i1::g.107276::m.107276/K04986/PKD2; polycystin 2